MLTRSRVLSPQCWPYPRRWTTGESLTGCSYQRLHPARYGAHTKGNEPKKLDGLTSRSSWAECQSLPDADELPLRSGLTLAETNSPLEELGVDIVFWISGGMLSCCVRSTTEVSYQQIVTYTPLLPLSSDNESDDYSPTWTNCLLGVIVGYFQGMYHSLTGIERLGKEGKASIECSINGRSARKHCRESNPLTTGVQDTQQSHVLLYTRRSVLQLTVKKAAMLTTPLNHPSPFPPLPPPPPTPPPCIYRSYRPSRHTPARPRPM